MKSVLTVLVAAALLLGVLAVPASAQEGTPIAVWQGHTYQWDWGYAGASGIIGTSFGGGFDYDYLGGKIVVGFGSNLDSTFTELFFEGVNYAADFTIGPNTITESQLVAKLGAKVIFEFKPNESISPTGEIKKPAGSIGITGWAGLYWQFFPGDFSSPAGANLGTVENDNLWVTLGLAFELPLVDSDSIDIAITGWGSIDGFVYFLERFGWPIDRITGTVEDRGTLVDTGSGFVGDVDFENFTERFYATIGGTLTLMPAFNTYGEHNWRFYGGIAYTFREGDVSKVAASSALAFNFGFVFGW